MLPLPLKSVHFSSVTVLPADKPVISTVIEPTRSLVMIGGVTLNPAAALALEHPTRTALREIAQTKPVQIRRVVTIGSLSFVGKLLGPIMHCPAKKSR